MRHSVAVAGAGSVVAGLLLAACTSSSAPVPDPNTASLTAVAGQSGATLNVLTGTALLTIKTANFGAGGSLLRVGTPPGGPAPHLRDTAAQPGASTDVFLSAPGAAQLTVTLNTAVAWQLNLGGGTTRTDADLRDGQVTGIAITAGSDVINLALPRPRGDVRVQLAAGTSQFLLSLPEGVPAQVIASGGAGGVSLEGRHYTGVAAGAVFSTAGWGTDTAGFEVDATAGADQVTVTARPGGSRARRPGGT
jgi:hypothetical protein